MDLLGQIPLVLITVRSFRQREVARIMIPAPRPASEPSAPHPVPFRLPWPQTRVACRPVIGDALLLQYPEVAKTLAEGSSSEEAAKCIAVSVAAAAEECPR